MKRTQLHFESIQKVKGSSELSVIVLTDEQRKRSLAVVCDDLVGRQIEMRLSKPEVCNSMMPEVLVRMLPTSLEMMVVGIYDGQYQVMLMDMETGTTFRIRMSDAVLLTLASRVPLYIEENLMRKQSAPYDEHAVGIPIPINTMDTRGLQHALDLAVEQEDYEFASQLRDEINRRTDKANERN